MEDFLIPTLNVSAILPVIIVTFGTLALMFIDFWVDDDRKDITGWLTLFPLGAALTVAFFQWDDVLSAFNDSVLLDKFGTYLNILYLITAMLSVLISVGYIRKHGKARSEFYFLMLFSVVGMMLMGMANDLIIVFLALELLSIPLYIMSGFDRSSLNSEESALKYFLLGAFSSGFFVYGIALLYGAVGSTALPDIAAGLGDSGVLGLAGAAMLLVGLLFKVGVVPFHMWTPDVYQGAPTAVTAFMSVGAKVAGFAAMMRVLNSFGAIDDTWIPALSVVAALTMIVGNLAAITQTNIKRMLAYSSIAHAGYILMAVIASARSDAGVGAALFYMLTYMFTNLGAFAAVLAMEKFKSDSDDISVENGGLELNDYKGLAKRNLPFALVLMFFMLSLTGIPLTGGFAGKFFVFKTALEADLVILVVIAALTSVVSAFYYLRVIFNMFMHDGEAEIQDSTGALRLVMGLSAIATLILGIIPARMFAIAESASAAFDAIRQVAGG